MSGMSDVIITGHTSGIGKSLYNFFTPGCIGLSRSTGFDITKDDFNWHGDVFINNAINLKSYEGMFGQVRMFRQAWKLWRKFTDRTIVNIGSISIDYPTSPTYLQMMYASSKSALANASKSCQYIENGPRVIHVKLGAVDTPLIKNYNMPKMPVEEIIDAILDALDNRYCFEIDLSPRGFRND